MLFEAGDLVAIGTIARSLDGIPIALEFAAARVSHAHLDAAREEIRAFAAFPRAGCGARSGPTTPTSYSTARSAA